MVEQTSIVNFCLCKICLNTKHRVVSFKVKFIQSSFQGARVEIVGLDSI